MNGKILIVILFWVATTGCAIFPTGSEDRRTHLYLDRPEAVQVALASSIDGFIPHPASRDPEGRWTVILPVEDEFRYFFIVDQQVVTPCRIIEKDDFGGVNCVYDGLKP